MEKRFFVDKRVGCIAIRDRQHPEFDADHQGLDPHIPDVVEFEMGTYKADGWDLSEDVVRRFKEKCLALNETNMEKITVTERKLLGWSGEHPISEIKSAIENLEKDGFTHIDFDYIEEWDVVFVKVEATKERPETDEEAKARIDEAAKREAIQKERDLETYHELKAKYNL